MVSASQFVESLEYKTNWFITFINPRVQQPGSRSHNITIQKKSNNKDENQKSNKNSSKEIETGLTKTNLAVNLAGVNEIEWNGMYCGANKNTSGSSHKAARDAYAACYVAAVAKWKQVFISIRFSMFTRPSA